MAMKSDKHRVMTKFCFSLIGHFLNYPKVYHIQKKNLIERNIFFFHRNVRTKTCYGEKNAYKNIRTFEPKISLCFFLSAFFSYFMSIVYFEP